MTLLDISFSTYHKINLNYFFSKCSKLTSLDLSNFNTNKFNDMVKMFYNFY